MQITKQLVYNGKKFQVTIFYIEPNVLSADVEMGNIYCVVDYIPEHLLYLLRNVEERERFYEFVKEETQANDITIDWNYEKESDS